MIDVVKLYQQIGEQLRQHRERQGLTQTFVAAELGIDRASISNIEAGRHKLPLHILYRYCEILLIDTRDLIPASSSVIVEKTESVKVGELEEEVPASVANILRHL